MIDIMDRIKKIRLSFHSFPTTWGVIKLTENMVFFTKPPENNTLSRYYNLATMCSSQEEKVLVYQPSKQLNIVDIRVLKYILLETKIAQYNMVNGQYNDTVQLTKCMHQLGLVGYSEQSYYSRNRQKPLEHFGNILDLDIDCLKYLSDLLNTTIDGYICPNMYPSTIHHVCIFNQSNMTLTSQITTQPDQMVVDNLESITTYLEIPKITMEVYTNAKKSSSGGRLVKKGGVINGQNPSIEVEPPLTQEQLLPIQLEELEEQIEANTLNPVVQCGISRNDTLQEFVGKIFILLTCILHESLYLVMKSTRQKKETIRHTIHYHYRPLVEHRKNKTKTDIFVLKPGMDKLLATTVVDKIIQLFWNTDGEKKSDLTSIQTGLQTMFSGEKESKIFDKILSILRTKYSLSEMLGAIYGITVHAGMFSVIYQAFLISNDNKELLKNKILLELKSNFEIVLTNVQDMFGLPKSYKTEDLLLLLQTNNELLKNTVCYQTYFTEDNGIACKKTRQTKEQIHILNVSKNNLSKIVLDMMVTQNNQDAKGISVVRRNLNNQEYIRKRRDKQIGTYTNVTPMSKCPVFNSTKSSESTNYNIMMVNGDEWYEVVPNGLFENIMKKYKRTCKAGPSGSTLMLMNMVFGLFGNFIKPTPVNQKMLLLCIISDFVPVYHSLTEVLMIYSREYQNNPYDSTFNVYTIDENPVKWLANHFGITITIDMTLATLVKALLAHISPNL